MLAVGWVVVFERGAGAKLLLLLEASQQGYAVQGFDCHGNVHKWV